MGIVFIVTGFIFLYCIAALGYLMKNQLEFKKGWKEYSQRPEATQQPEQKQRA